MGGAAASRRSADDAASAHTNAPRGTEAVNLADPTPAPRHRQSLWRRMTQSCRRVQVTPEMITRKRNTLLRIEALALIQTANIAQLGRQIAGIKQTMLMLNSNRQIDEGAKKISIATLGQRLAIATRLANGEQAALSGFERQRAVVTAHLQFMRKMLHTKHLKDNYEAIADGMSALNADATKLSEGLAQETDRLALLHDQQDEVDFDATVDFGHDPTAMFDPADMMASIQEEHAAGSFVDTDGQETEMYNGLEEFA